MANRKRIQQKLKQRRKTRKPAQNNAVNPSINKQIRSLGAMLGNMVLPGIGGNIGSSLANQGHRAFKSITGYGDYTVGANSLIGGDSVPKFSNISAKSIRVSNREFILDVKSSATIGQFDKFFVADINPTHRTLFPWLSNIARCYDEYKLHGMIFEFKTTSVDALNSTNTALGKVIMATQYNPLSKDFANAQEMENYEYCSVSKPSMSSIHPIECKGSQTPLDHLYVRHEDEVGAVSDKRFYDFGTFTLATIGMQAASVQVGELWISYDIEFFKPRLPNTPDMAAHWKSVGQTLPIGGNIFGPSGASLVQQIPSTPISLNNALYPVLSFPKDFYGHVQVSLTIYAPITTTWTTTGFAHTGNVTALYDYVGPSTAIQSNATTGAGGASYVLNGWYTIAGAGTITLLVDNAASVANVYTDLIVTLIARPATA